jgi:hypothetical protein
MLLFWRIRYLDSRDTLFKNRDLWLDTHELDPVMKAALETVYAINSNQPRRGLMRFRHLFRDMAWREEEIKARLDRSGLRNVFIPDYFEDETGAEISMKQIAVALTGNPEADFVPTAATLNDIEYLRAEKPPIDLNQITLAPEQLQLIGYFVRDLGELLASTFYRNAPATLTNGGSRGSCWILETTASDEEIRSFVTIFRRLYMENEPANFAKAAAAFAQALQGHPLATWVQGSASQFDEILNEAPGPYPFVAQGKLGFTQKRLIDVYLYTQYAHQPDERRTRQFNECLASVDGDRSLLAFLFLSEIWRCALTIRNPGLIIDDFYKRYRQTHSASLGVLDSMRTGQPGIGALETQEERETRVLGEKTEELATSLWRAAGQPAGGHARFLGEARKRLLSALGRPDGEPGRP